MFGRKVKGAQVGVVGERLGSRSAEETRQIGRALRSSLRGGEVILLRGSLGAGKSVLARGIADAFGVQEWHGSPTFTIVNEYETTPALYHVDLYRLSEAEIEDLGLEEYVRPDSVMVVEWADRAASYLEGLAEGEVVWIDIAFVGQGEERSIEIRRLPAPSPAEKSGSA
jgi:tRNA threonylcarbamoyladenosine biosynthesis protein TsaE